MDISSQPRISGKKILVTGGAGFIGSNLVDELLLQGNEVVCLDNFSTGKRENLVEALKSKQFTLIEGDIRNYEDCQEAVKGCDLVFHQAALGSIPRSIADPMTSTDVNIGGFVKMLFASYEAGIRRFIYAASSSTYGDHPDLPKVEHKIGNALSPYAITKYVDELFATNFTDTYGIETIGLRYFNVFGRRQDPNGGYAAAIPKFLSLLIQHESPKINGDGTNSRDFTYIDNVIQANILAAEVPREQLVERLSAYYSSIGRHFKGTKGISEVFNVAFGERENLNNLVNNLKANLSSFDPEIASVEIVYGPKRKGDIPHSLASIKKAREVLGYQPLYNLEQGLSNACDWYWNNIKARIDV
ncbi:SDR family NAD(P)-dependent oxidoreductase [Echinicola shivajiensis]|uniref:SDR family NAD(P)-dependent oxidoreductase n=1 Tax=Echinicola shivajiensis TaxID=1035916 RepID=UPI001BFC47B8|nr:SDR family NAD(P)-dependent oxidoreductase [Echinicola shivajiensis]